MRLPPWTALPPLLALAASACVAVPLEATVQNQVNVNLSESGSNSGPASIPQAAPPVAPESAAPPSSPASPPASSPAPAESPSPSGLPATEGNAPPASLAPASQPPLNAPAPTPTPGPLVGGGAPKVTTHSLGVPGNSRSFAFTGPTTGFLSVGWGLVKTEDGGLSWRVPGSVPEVNDPSLDGIRLAFSPNGQHGVLASDEGVAFTGDGGKTWRLGVDRNSRWGGGVVAFDDGSFLVPTQYRAEVTRDQGQTWSDVQDFPGSVNAPITRVGQRAVGAEVNGQLVAWNPADGSTERLAQVNTADLQHDFGVVRALAFADANTGLAVLIDGQVMLSQDGGRSFRQVLKTESLHQARVSWGDANHAFVWVRPTHSKDLLWRLVRQGEGFQAQSLNADTLVPSWAASLQATGPDGFLISGASSVRRVLLPN